MSIRKQEAPVYVCLRVSTFVCVCWCSDCEQGTAGFKDLPIRAPGMCVCVYVCVTLMPAGVLQLYSFPSEAV